MNKATITITEQQLEALNKLVTAGVVSIDSWQAERCPDVAAAHDWLVDARQALLQRRRWRHEQHT